MHLVDNVDPVLCLLYTSVSHVDTGADECSHEVSNDKYVLRLGSEDETITGPHTYTCLLYTSRCV